MKCTHEITVTIRCAWWVRAYIDGVILMSCLTGLRPDEEKLTYWLTKGIRMKVEK